MIERICQPNLRRRGLVALLALLVASALPAQGPSRPPEARFDQELGDQLPLHLTFRDESGAEVQLGEFFKDKPVILTPVYYKCPMLCGLELNGLVRCLRAMKLSAGEDFTIVTYSIDPTEKPSLAAQKRMQYLAQYGRDGTAPGWRFLTGDAPQIEELSKAIGFHAVHEPISGQYTHAAGIVVCTPQGKISRYLFGVEFSPRDLRLAVGESSNEGISNPIDQALLLCYMYDPSRGKYGLAVLNIIRAGGIGTVAAMAIFIVSTLRRERRLTSHQHIAGDGHG